VTNNLQYALLIGTKKAVTLNDLKWHDDRAGYYQLQKLCPLIESMTAEAARTIDAAFISCWLDYLIHCSMVCDTHLRKLQSVQNATERLIIIIIII